MFLLDFGGKLRKNDIDEIFQNYENDKILSFRQFVQIYNYFFYN